MYRSHSFKECFYLHKSIRGSFHRSRQASKVSHPHKLWRIAQLPEAVHHPSKCLWCIIPIGSCSRSNQGILECRPSLWCLLPLGYHKLGTSQFLTKSESHYTHQRHKLYWLSQDVCSSNSFRTSYYPLRFCLLVCTPAAELPSQDSKWSKIRPLQQTSSRDHHPTALSCHKAAQISHCHRRVNQFDL